MRQADAPVSPPHSSNDKKDVIMLHQDTSRVFFSSYRKLKHSNPDAYHKVSTIAEMVKTQRQMGKAFYDLMDDQQ